MIPEISVDELAALLPSVALIDVRNPDEYEEARVPGAVLVPLGELQDRVAEVPDDRVVYLICRSGARSMRAAEFLAGLDRNVVNVAGGTLAWIDSGRSVDSGVSTARDA